MKKQIIPLQFLFLFTCVFAHNNYAKNNMLSKSTFKNFSYSSPSVVTPDPHDSLLVIVPNVFTPNSDGVNDSWSIIVQGYGITLLELKTTIYDRWGSQVFHTTNIRAVWSGHNTVGKLCDSGSYFYVISYINGATNEQVTLKGFIELLR